jgi:hypothetical protein
MQPAPLRAPATARAIRLAPSSHHHASPAFECIVALVPIAARALVGQPHRRRRKRTNPRRRHDRLCHIASKPRPNRRAPMAPQHDRLRSNPIGGNRCNRAALPLRRDAVGTSGKSGIPAPSSSPCSKRSSGSAPPHPAPRHDSSKAGESLCGYAQPAANAAISRPCGSLCETAVVRAEQPSHRRGPITRNGAVRARCLAWLVHRRTDSHT